MAVVWIIYIYTLYCTQFYWRCIHCLHILSIGSDDYVFVDLPIPDESVWSWDALGGAFLCMGGTA